MTTDELAFSKPGMTVHKMCWASVKTDAQQFAFRAVRSAHHALKFRNTCHGDQPFFR